MYNKAPSTLVAIFTALVSGAAMANQPSEAYQVGYNAGRFVAQALPFVGAVALVALAVWLVIRVRAKRSRNVKPQA